MPIGNVNHRNIVTSNSSTLSKPHSGVCEHIILSQAHILSRNSVCTDGAEVSQFRAYCTLVVKPPKTSFQRLQVAFNDAMRILLQRPRGSCASDIFVASGVIAFQTVLRNLK